MEKQTLSFECGHTRLKRTGIRGTRKCSYCGAFIHLQNDNWLRKLLLA